MIQKEIKIHRVFFRKKENGWINFLKHGWIDTFREFHPEPHRYSWWSQRFPTVRLQNKGWRIDYINVTEPLKNKLKRCGNFSRCQTF